MSLRGTNSKEGRPSFKTMQISDTSPAEALSKCFVQSLAGGFGKRGGFGVAEDLNRLLRGIDYQPAVAALSQMLFDGRSEGGIERFVQIIR
jgi:hypothetical protein